MGRAAGWAPFFSETELRMFLTLVEAEVQSHGIGYRMGDGLVEVEWEDGPQSLGLSNLAQVCKNLAATDWPAAVTKHFDLVFGSASEEANLRAMVHDFEQVKPFLRLRLYDAWVEEQVLRHVGDGLVAALVFDLPSAMRSVSRSEMKVWGRTDDELYAIALDNLKLEEPPETQVIRGAEDVPIQVVEGGSYYTATRALLLEEDVIPEGHPYGAVVAIPNRHVFFYHLIEDSRVILAVNALVSLAHEANQRGPGSVSDQVFWTRGRPSVRREVPGARPLSAREAAGEFVHIPCGMQDGALHVSPPGAFVKEVLERLAEPKS